ncbi:MAG: glycoside hydrolase family 2 protein [Candidatus Helarchaeota archaeon]
MKLDLNGNWYYLIDIYNSGVEEKWFEKDNYKDKFNLKQISLPSCWNNIIQNGELTYDRYECIMWFFKEFEIANIDEMNDYLLQFNGSNYVTKVWLNEKYIGKNEGGFLPFKFKVNEYIKKGKNLIAARADNIGRKSGIPGKNTDWYNWGGIYRDIFLNILPIIRVKKIKIKTLNLINKRAKVQFSYKLTDTTDFNWEISYSGRKVINGQIRSKNKAGKVIIEIINPKLWSPQKPQLYLLKLTNNSGQKIKSIMFGIRLIEIKNGKLYINKKIINLKGVSLHEELMPYGRAISKTERKNDIIRIKQFGFNALRNSHYPHDESLIELVDKLGIFILEEIPIYWNIDFKNPKVFKLGVKMISALIERDYNHPSVIMWSLGNEIPVENRYCRHVLEYLYKLARKLDDSRIITHVSRNFWGDPLRKLSDIVCINLYFGWYMFSEKNLNFILELIKSTAPDKPWFITEFGAGAKFGFHSKLLEKFSEEKQASIISHSIEVFNSKDFIQGHFIWIFRDFRSPLRQNKYQMGFNRKGVVSEKNELKIIAKIYSKIKNKTKKMRKFRFLSALSKFPFYYREQVIYDILISKAMAFFEDLIIGKYYTNLKNE